MVERARLVPPALVRQDWPWHHVKTTSLKASDVWSGDRRLEGSAYLASGYGIRLAFQAQPGGWTRLQALVRAWMPNRLKGIVVSPSVGRPYLSATQMLDLRPAPRKFLALEPDAAKELSVSGGTILVTRSGTVGRSTVTHRLHEKAVVSDDLLRIVPHDPKSWGWVYASLRTSTARQMMKSLHYGHMIKHLEPAHVHALPIPVVDATTLAAFDDAMKEMLRLRNRSYDRLLEAEECFAAAIGASALRIPKPISFSVKSRLLGTGRRRFEANFYQPSADVVLQQFADSGHATQSLSELTERVWWGARFRRVFGDGGIPYYSADDLWTLNSSPEKRILVDHDDARDMERYMVKPGWIVMACSGQTYGLNGSVDLVTSKLAQSFLSHDLIRIAPKSSIRAGYLLTALGHPTLGRPLVMRNAYGSSIPHLDPDDVASIPIVRLSSSTEAMIADAMEESVVLRHQADDLENKLASDAETLTDSFLQGTS